MEDSRGARPTRQPARPPANATARAALLTGSARWQASACAAGAAAVRLRSEYPLAAMERAKQADGEDDGSGETAAAAAAPMSKKQKRKAQRQHGRLGLCNNVVRSGDPSACPYGDKCKYSHDIAAYRASKPVDLPGRCPFAHPCPFGIQCRWEGSHAQAVADAEEGRPVGVVRESECSNFLRKPLMNGLRKREYDFSRADASTIKAGGKLSKFATKKGHKSVAVADAATGSPAPGPRAAEGEGEVRDKPEPAFERKAIDFDGKLYLAPLTTVGNLPFRRLCVELGIDITVGEMAMCTNLLQAQPSEWALLRRHKSEKIFGAQICGSFPDSVARACQVVEENTDVNFIDINMGCPIDLVCNAGAGASMLHRPARMEQVVRAGAGALRELPFTVKTRTGFNDGENVTHKLAPKMKEWGAAALTLHGRTRQQRYSRPADWSYVAKTAGALKVRARASRGCHRMRSHPTDRVDRAPHRPHRALCARRCRQDEGGTRQLPLIGNGDVYTHEDYFHHLEEHGVATCMLARGMLIKPWLATEIKERRTWDISGSERFDLMKKFANYSLEHYGSDERGVESSRRFLLEWMSFTHRYVPVGLLETQVGMQFRPPPFSGHDDRETLLASPLAKVSHRARGRRPALEPTPSRACR